MKAIRYSKYDWGRLWPKIKEGHPPSINISWVCKKELGFIIREHYNIDNDKYEIHLDFYDEAMKTLFILRWM